MNPALIVGIALNVLFAADELQETVAPVDAATISPYETQVVGKSIDPADPALYGVSATTLTRRQIEALPGGDTLPITAFVSMQPGVVQDSFGSELHVRAADGAILYVLDGIQLFAPSVGTVGDLLNAVPTRLVQSVDVLTGGFPVEYGYSLGGVVDIKTREPTASPTGEVQLLYGTYDHVDVAANYSQRLGKLSLVASANFLTTGRGLDTPNAVTALNSGRIGGNAFLKAGYELGNSDRLQLLATYQEDQFHVPIDATMLGLSAAPPGAIRGNDVYGNPPPPFVPYDARPTDRERTFFGALSYRHQGDISSQVSLYARGIYEDFFCDPTRQLGGTADPGSFCSNFTRDAYHFGLFGYVSEELPTSHTWKAGIQIDEAPSKVNFSLFNRNDALATGGPDPAQTLNGGDAINTLTGGIFLEDRIELGQFTLLPGLRLDLQNTTFGPANLDNKFFAGPSARLGASYALSEAVIFHGFVGYVWEAPTNFDAPVLAPLVNPALAGQKLAIDIKAAKTWTGQLAAAFHPSPRITFGIDFWGRILQDWLDHQNIGNTALFAAFNWGKGWAFGGDVYATGEVVRFWDNQFILEGFANLNGQHGEAKHVDSLAYLFPPDFIQAGEMWTEMDHVQYWTANVGLSLHDLPYSNNLSVRFNYGNGYHTGINTAALVPEHATVDVTLSHTFNLPVPTTVAIDAFNLFNDIYAFRLGTGFFGNSQYAPLRQVDVRVICHLG